MFALKKVRGTSPRTFFGLALIKFNRLQLPHYELQTL